MEGEAGGTVVQILDSGKSTFRSLLCPLRAVSTRQVSPSLSMPIWLWG